MKATVKKPTAKEAKEAISWPLWEKEESTFPWQYDEKETCLILKGKASVKKSRWDCGIWSRRLCNLS